MKVLCKYTYTTRSGELASSTKMVDAPVRGCLELVFTDAIKAECKRWDFIFGHKPSQASWDRPTNAQLTTWLSETGARSW